MAGDINFSGLNGIDFNAILDAVMTVEGQPLKAIQGQQAAIQAKDDALTQVGAQIDDFKSVVTDLISQSAFTQVAATSSDSTVLTTSAGSDAVTGHYDIVIDHLAKNQVTASANGYSLPSNVAATGGSLSFTIGGETTTAIAITSSTTLAGLKDLINKQGSGVVASIVNTGNSNKLVISSRGTGAAQAFTINNSLTNSEGVSVGFGVVNTQDAMDASLTVNGLAIESSSNTVSNAIPGISFNLVKGGNAAIDVSANYDKLKTSVKALVSDYNKLRSFYARNSTIGSDGSLGPLANDSVMRQVMKDIRTAFQSSNSNGGAFHYLSEVGVELTTTGDMKFVESTFNTAIADRGTDLAKLFHGTNNNGIFNALKTKLDSLDSTAGLIKTTHASIARTLDQYRDRISAQQDRLETRRANLKKMYAAADQAMSQLTSQGSALTAMINKGFGD